ncbi:hypothetical protein ACFQ6U_13585 [Streptomyces sp. NPDC056465]|uniref:hypothetical protein n=1 Tax=Streptomyces sp. NPDC056465 TaxID=3345829 RepID=UPI0036BC3C15
MTPEILARIVTARGMRDLSDAARNALAKTSDTISPAERIEQARELRQMANAIVDLVVLGEALGGASWEEITQALNRRDPGSVAGEYEGAVAEWQAMPEDERQAAAEGAEYLDAWFARHREDIDPAVERPVGDLHNRR